MNGYNNMIMPGGRINGPSSPSAQNAPKPNTAVQPGKNEQDFGSILSQQIDAQAMASSSVQFSKHANMRLDHRDITLSAEQLKRIETGVDSARQKGIQDSLVLVDNIALVVNVRSRTVVTAMNNDQENVFTNIDGAVIV